MIRNVLQAFRHYADFSGRTQRRAFWDFITTTHTLLILLLLPAFAAMLELLRTLTEDVAVLDAAVAIIRTPSEAQHLAQSRLLPAVEDVALPFVQDFATSHAFAAATLALAALWLAALIAPTAAATVRRLRDAGQSPLWVLALPMACIPEMICNAIGSTLCMVLFILCLQPTKIQQQQRKEPDEPQEPRRTSA